MADPFQNVDAAGADFIKIFADAMDLRQNDPTMEKIVATYLEALALENPADVIEIGAGAGAVSRRIAAQFPKAKITGYEPSQGFVTEARARAQALPNLTFEQADGSALPRIDGQTDAAILHTVLSHVTDPAALIAEAARILRPGGKLAVCDADFSKSTFSNFPTDPLDACAKAFQSGFVTDPHLTAKLKNLTITAGFRIESFELTSRVTTDNDGMRPWVMMTTKTMVEQGDIGQALADALLGEYDRRRDASTLFGYQVFATLIASKP